MLSDAAIPDREVAVARGRWPGWLARYRTNHPDTVAAATATEVRLDSPDGARAVVSVPFPPLDPDAGTTGDAALDALTRHIARDHRFGVLLVRRGGHAVGVFEGDRLVVSKIGGGYVQGRTKAGGWSQQRYARRRANQTRQVYEAAAELAVRLLLPETDRLEALVTGGHREGVEAVLADPRLAALRRLVRPGLVPTADPRLRVLEEVGTAALAVSVTLNALA